MQSLVGHDRGPGIAASVILKVLMDELVDKSILNAADVARILDIADSALTGMGANNIAVRDARDVVKKMRGPEVLAGSVTTQR